MRRQHSHRISVCSVLVLAFAACVCANTWYVDPVDGNNNYTGTSPFYVPGTNNGPVKTIERAVNYALQYDIVVLLDGVYGGYQNTSNNVLHNADSKHLYIISDGGPEYCTLKLYETVYFNVPLYGPSQLETVISGVTFTTDTGAWQHVIYIQGDSRPRFEECVFTGYEFHGALVAVENGQPVFDGCRFTENKVHRIIQCINTAAPEIKNCSFTLITNYATDTDPLSLINASHNTMPAVRNCTFTDNSSSTPLYAIRVADAASVIVDECVFEDNWSSSSNTDACAAIYFSGGMAGFVSGSRFENNRGPWGTSNRSAGILAIDAPDLTIRDCTFEDNAAGIYIYAPVEERTFSISDCQFVGNTSLNQNPVPSENIGGIVLQVFGTLMDIDIRRCVFQKNYGGIRTQQSMNFASFNVTHCLFAYNTYIGLGVNNMYNPTNPGGLLHVNFCTFVENAQYELISQYALVENTIVRRTPASAIPVNVGLTFNYCNVQGGWTGTGTGNIDVDPLFADGGTWHPDPLQRICGTDYHLKSTAGRWDLVTETWVFDTEDSPCIDAGDPAAVPVFETPGSGGRVNMGAYGNTPQASRSDICEGGDDGSGVMFSDINHDCLVNLADFAVMAGQWLQSTLGGSL